MRTQVGIIGAGPAGLLLARMLQLQGIDSVVLEHYDRHRIETRLRAGVLEHGSAQTLRDVGAGGRMDAEGMVHTGIELRFDHARHRIDFRDLTDQWIMVYGQQEVVRDLITVLLDDGGDVRFEVDDVRLAALDSAQPRIAYRQGDADASLECDFVVGVDGFHGVSRGYLPDQQALERHYPYGWLGILAEAPPSSEELIYARHETGFALHSMRTPQLSRLYVQVHPDEDVAAWPDERIWEALHTRLATDDGFALTEGPILEKGITGMRSFVAGSMQHGRLFIAGDAAHIVPPTGAKGANLAMADARLLSRAIGGFYADGREDLLAAYTETALRRVWRATHFSWWMTTMLHVSPNGEAFDDALALSHLRNVAESRAMATSLAENYTGMPYDAGWSYR